MNNFKEYIEKAMVTKNKDLSKEETLANAAMGLAGEVGEVVDIIKKHLYQGHELDIEKLSEEVGDVFWYFALLSSTTGLDLDQAMSDNIVKLQKRYENGFNSDDSINRDL